MKNLSEYLLNHYKEHPDQVIINILHSGKADLPLTYREMIHGACGYVNTYKEYGIEPGEVVLLILQHGKDLLYAYFGAVLHGLIPSIMPFLTEKLLPDRYRADLTSLIAVTKPKVIVTYPTFVPEVNAVINSSVEKTVSVFVCENAGSPCNPEWGNLGGIHRNPNDIALLQHSSGTTGLQKGVALSHKAIMNQLSEYGDAIHLKPEDVFVSWLPLYHDMGLIACWLMPILLGNPLVIMSPFDWIRAPYRLLQAVSRYQGTLSWLPNFAYNFCAQKIRDRDLEGVNLSSWRAISNCSEPMRWESHQLFYDRFKRFELRYEALTTCYAMAENVFAVTQGGINGPVFFEDIDRDSLQIHKFAQKSDNKKPSIRMLGAGKTISNTEVCILDERGIVLKDRHVGEVAIKGNCILTEYYHRPDATEKAFKNGWYLTGDLGYLVEGELYITGRKKDLIIVGGKNIFPQDLEMLAYEVNGVHNGRASAFGIFNEEMGTEEVVLVAEVDTDDPKEMENIGNDIRNSVTRGSAISLRFVYIVGRNWLVKTSSGKTARSANREKFLLEMKEKNLTY